jgi:hypothetical protein
MSPRSDYFLAAHHRLPVIYPLRFYAARGGLMSYGFNTTDLSRRGASYVDRILKGESPADLAVEGVLGSCPMNALTSLARGILRFMEREMLNENLRQAEAQVARADRQVVKQRWTVARLERDGQDTTAARAILAQIEQARKQHIAERDRLRRKLGL